MLCDAVIVGVDDRLAACLTINRLKQELPIYFFFILSVAHCAELYCTDYGNAHRQKLPQLYIVA
jgi:hypothetical protein